MTRYLVAAAMVALLAGCSTLHLGGGGPPGLKIVGNSTYCGTASQASEVHYFATPDAYQNWIDYRNVNGLDAEGAKKRGVVVVEMGQRPTGGYKLKLNRGKTKIQDNTLTLAMDWHAPRLDAAVSQAMITQCLAIRPPRGSYNEIRVVDQIDNSRGVVDRQDDSAG